MLTLDFEEYELLLDVLTDARAQLALVREDNLRHKSDCRFSYQVLLNQKLLDEITKRIDLISDAIEKLHASRISEETPDAV